MTSPRLDNRNSAETPADKLRDLGGVSFKPVPSTVYWVSKDGVKVPVSDQPCPTNYQPFRLNKGGIAPPELPFDPESVLLEAYSLVNGARNADYGHPFEDFACTAACFTAFLRRRGKLKEGPENDLSPDEVPIFNIYQKLSREAHAHKRDNPVDISGYSETLHKTITEMFRRAREQEEKGKRDEETKGKQKA